MLSNICNASHQVLFHDKLYRKRYEFDLALLILEREIPLSSEVDTVCLPPLEIDQAYFENMICTSTMEGDGTSTHSHVVNLLPIPHSHTNYCHHQPDLYIAVYDITDFFD